jgi:hypothetical protein
MEADAAENVGTVSSALDVVSNPGEFTFLLTDDSIFHFNGLTWPAILIGDTSTPYAYFEVEIASDGTVDTLGSSSLNAYVFSTGCAAGSVSATLQLRPGLVGSVDPHFEELAIDFVARVKFTEASAAWTCTTANFAIEATGGLHNACAGSLGSGEFCLDASSITVPSFNGTQCNGSGPVTSCVDSYFDLGGGNASMLMHGNSNPVIQ